MQQQKAVKLVVVGDGSVGKTCLLLSYATDKFPQDYIPTVFENYTTKVKIDNEDYALTLWDTAGQEGYEKLRAVSYQGADIVLITFSVVDVNSFENAMNKWLNEIAQNIPQNAIILFVGSKTDLREYNQNFVSIQAMNIENVVLQLKMVQKKYSVMPQHYTQKNKQKKQLPRIVKYKRRNRDLANQYDQNKRINKMQLIFHQFPILPLMQLEAPSNLVARISSTYLMIPISTVLYSVSLAYYVLQASHSASFQAFPVEAEANSLAASFLLLMAAFNQLVTETNLFSASDLAFYKATLYSSKSWRAYSKFNQAQISSSQSSMIDYSNEALNSAILSQTLYNFSAEKVEAN